MQPSRLVSRRGCKALRFTPKKEQRAKVKRSRLKLPPAEYRVLLDHVFIRDGWKCRHCKCRNGLHGHHIIYRSQGGDDKPENLITLCNDRGCHDAIHANNLVILAASGNTDDTVDANRTVKFLRRNGWRPR